MANTLHQLKRATEIVARYRARGNVFPRELRDCGRGDPESQQEYRDACKVKTWKYSLLGKNIYNCSDEIRDYLDENMPGWCDRVYSHQGQSSSVQMQKAVMIVQRYRERGNVLPRRLKDPTKAQETKDAINISTWKSSLKGYNRVTCSKELCTYLDDNMPGWRIDHHKSKPRSALGKERARKALLAGTTTGELDKKERSTELLLPIAQGIVKRFKENNSVYPSLKLACRKDPARAQEYKDAKQLHSWKSHTDKSLAPEVFAYLDEHMKDWKNSHVTHTVKNFPISKAREIFRRCSMRNGAFPQTYSTPQSDPVHILEHKDALQLRNWKIAYTRNPSEFCGELRDYLDDKLSEWRNIDIVSPLPSTSQTARVTSAALPKKRSLPVQNQSSDSQSTDNELSSDNSDSSACGSDDEDCYKTKRMRLHYSAPSAESLQSMGSDESAGIAALLQLSAGNQGVTCVQETSVLPTPPSLTSSFNCGPASTPMYSHTPANSAMIYPPAHVPGAYYAPNSYFPTAPPASVSTYGNRGRKAPTSVVQPSYHGGLELYMSGMLTGSN